MFLKFPQLIKLKQSITNKIEIVTEDDIVKAIENKTPNTVILHKVGPVGDRNQDIVLRC